MDPLMKFIRTTLIAGKSWKSELLTFLTNYRATPHGSTEKTPAELMLRRKIITALPAATMKDDKMDKVQEEAKLKDRQAKDRMKKYSGQRKKSPKIKIGDRVLVKLDKVNKFSPAYKPTPLKVIAVKHSMVTAIQEDSHKTVTRNRAFYKLLTGDKVDQRTGHTYSPDESDYEFTEA
jgi:translation initiation factor IF-1